MSSGRTGWSPWQSDTLRMRYRPRGRIGQVFLTVVPWIDLAFIAVFFIGVRDLVVLQPAIRFDLPVAPIRETAHGGMSAVLLRFERADGFEHLVFFDDERFRVHAPDDMRAIQQALGNRIRTHGQRELLLHVDRQVEHGMVMKLVNLAREAGVTRVNVSLKPQ